MFRKFAAATLALVLAVGAAFAEEIKGTFVKFADGKLTLKVEDKEKEFTIPADLKIKRKGKDGNDVEVEASKALGSKRINDKTKITVTTKDDKVTDLKIEGGMKKKDN